MNAKGMRILATEIFKTINNLNPSFMKEMFTPKVQPRAKSNKITFKSHDSTN